MHSQVIPPPLSSEVSSYFSLSPPTISCLDLHAMGAQPVSALALCVLPYGPEKQVLVLPPSSPLTHILSLLHLLSCAAYAVLCCVVLG
jgi:hypothetical protein